MNNLQEKVIRAMVDMYGFYSIEELSEMTNISVSSIKHSLGDIAEQIEEYGARLLRVPRKGICMVASDKEREKIVEELDSYANSNPESFVYRKNYILDILFNFPANYTIGLFSEELCVSRQVIQKDLNEIKEYLKQFHLKLIKRRNRGIEILGHEFDFRQALIDIRNAKYWKHAYIEDLPAKLDYRISKRAYTFFSQYYSKNDIMMVQEYLAQSEKKLGIILIDISFCRLTEYLLMSKSRIEEGKKITNTADRKMTELEKSYLEAAKGILDKMFPMETEMDLEYRFLAAKLFVAKTCDPAGKVQDEKLMDLAEDYIFIVLKAIQKENAIRLRELEKQIAVFLQTIKIKRDYMLAEWDDLHKDVQQQLHSIYAVCLAYAARLEEELGFVLTQDEIAWITLLIHQTAVISYGSRQGIFVTATDPYTTAYDAMKIENEIDNLEIVKMLHIYQYDPDRAKGKIVISTVPLKQKRENEIEITKHVSPMDLNKIRNCIDKYEKQRQNQKVIDTIRHTFQKELILTDVSVNTKKEAIQEASRLLMEQGCLEQDVTGKVYDLEEKRPTTIGSQIAMVHIYKESVKKSGIAILRIKYPVRWSENSKVKLVFFLAINYEQSNEILMLFKFLYSLIDHKDMINKMIEAKDPETIYDFLMKEIG